MTLRLVSRSARRPFHSVIARLAALMVLCPLALGLACGGWALFPRLSGKLHEIEPGVFRSGQPSAALLNRLIRDRGIRTVLNLRGNKTGTPWFDAETRAAATGSATLVSIPMTANHEPDAATLARLVSALRNAPRPLLIHCEAGADRIGLAAALYQFLVVHRPAAVADVPLSFRYGHFPWLLSRSGAMDRTFERVAAEGVTLLSP